MNFDHKHNPHLVQEIEDDFRRGSLKYLVLLFAALVICMSLIAPRHVILVTEQPYPDFSLALQQ
jgi:hypothetical protein